MTIGVVVALYNGSKFLTQQLDTIRLQTKTVDKVVLCDDGSKDDTVKIVEEYITKYNLSNTWELVINPKNLGYSRNFYHGIELCDTDLIYLSDQDDQWRLNKIEKMTGIMEKNAQIDLLCCKHGIIDAEGNKMESVLEPSGNNSEEIIPINVDTIMRAYHWLGMAMCVRGSFIKNILPTIKNYTIAHDVTLALCAADRSSFYEYDFIGVDHRRHDNNLANEESRIHKLLDLKRKIRDIKSYNLMLSELLEASLPIGKDTKEMIEYRLNLSKQREKAILERSVKKTFKLYSSDTKKVLRFASVACDIWLICFGDYKDFQY